MVETSNKYRIWNKRYDFSEINRYNYHSVFKQYFGITTKKIALLAMLIVINIICAVISQFALGLGKIGGFLTIAITFWTVLVTYIAMGGFYAFIFLEITIWFRMALGDDIAQVVALQISDLTFLIIFMLVVFILNRLRFHFKIPQSKKWSYFIVLVIGMVIATLATSGLDVGYNKWFLIKFYGISVPAQKDITIDSWLLITIFWLILFNILSTVLYFRLFTMLVIY